MVCDSGYMYTMTLHVPVLILILLEYGLRLLKQYGELKKQGGLNPYSIGIWSATFTSQKNSAFPWRLNPYSIGIWSATPKIANH